MLRRDKDKNLRLEEILIERGWTFAGVALKDTPIRRETRALVIPLRGSDRTFTYNPDPDPRHRRRHDAHRARTDQQHRQAERLVERGP